MRILSSKAGGVVRRALASHQCGLVSTWCGCHIWVEFVIGSLLCSERFFSGYSGIPLSFAPRGFSPGTPVFPSPLLREVFLRVLRYSPLLCSVRFFSALPLFSKTNTFKFQFYLQRTDTFQRFVRNS